MDDQIVMDEIYRVTSMHGTDEESIQNVSQNFRRNNPHLEGLGVDGIIIFKRNLNK
jgi:hypothetical protein